MLKKFRNLRDFYNSFSNNNTFISPVQLSNLILIFSRTRRRMAFRGTTSTAVSGVNAKEIRSYSEREDVSEAKI